MKHHAGLPDFAKLRTWRPRATTTEERLMQAEAKLAAIAITIDNGRNIFGDDDSDTLDTIEQLLQRPIPVEREEP